MLPYETKRPIACFNVSSSGRFLEFVLFDHLQRSILKVDSEPFTLGDPNMLEVSEGIDRLKSVVRRVLDRNQVAKDSLVTLVLPSYFTRDAACPEGISGSELNMMMLSQAESYYLFKKVEPIVGVAKLLTEGRLVYSAYPKVTYLPIEQVFVDLKVPLVSVEPHVISTLRGLVASGFLAEEVSSDLSWVFMTVSDHTLIMTQMVGPNVQRIVETPLSGNDPDTSINQISEDFVQFCEYEIINKVIVVNNSTSILSSRLNDQIQHESAIFFDQNEGTLESLGSQDAQAPCSFEVLGAAMAIVDRMVPVLNVIQRNVYDLTVLQRKKDQVGIALIAIGALLFGLQFAINGLFGFMASQQDVAAADVQQKIQELKPPEEEFNKLKKQMFIQRAFNQNIRMNNLMITVFQSLPPDAWLDQVDMTSESNFQSYQVKIKGAALSPDPLNTYLQEVNRQLPGNALIPKLKPEQAYNNQQYFTFELAPAKGEKTQ